MVSSSQLPRFNDQDVWFSIRRALSDGGVTIVSLQVVGVALCIKVSSPGRQRANGNLKNPRLVCSQRNFKPISPRFGQSTLAAWPFQIVRDDYCDSGTTQNGETQYQR